MLGSAFIIHQRGCCKTKKLQKLRGYLKTNVNGSEFAEGDDDSRDHNMFAKADNPNEIGYFQGFMYDYDANTCHYIGPMDACHLYDMDRASADKRKTVLIPKGGSWFY